MTAPFSLGVQLQIPGTPGLPVDLLPFAVVGSYDSKVELEVVLPLTPGSKNVDFGSLPAAGAKGMLVYYEPVVAAPPIQLTLNGGDEPVELSSGGFLAFGSPTPATGITALSIAHTGAGRVRIWLLG